MRCAFPIVITGHLLSLLASMLLPGGAATAADLTQAPAADDQIVEFTDDTRIHGRILKLGTDDIFLQRTGFKEPLVFSLREIRRIVLRGSLSKAEIRDSKTNATLQFHGGGWVAGDLSSFGDGRFQMRIGKLADVAIDRGKVRWLFLSPANSPDACDGPGGAMGLAGWEGGDGWEATDAGLVARGQPVPLRRVLELPARVDIEFTGGDKAQENGVPIALLLGEGDDNRDENFTGSFIQVMLQSNNLSAGTLAAPNQPFKNFRASIPVDKNAPKPTRYRILHDRRTGRIVVLVNGKKAADWDGQWKRNASRSCKIVLQPGVGPGTPWPQQAMRVSPWDGNIEPDAKPDEAGKDLLSSDAPGRSAGSLEAVNADTVRFSGKDFSRKEPLFIRLAGSDPAQPQPRAIARIRLVQRGEFDATALDFRDGHIQVRTPFGGEIALPLAAIRSIEFPHSRAAAEADAAADRLVFKNGDVLRGTLLAANSAGAVGWRPARGAALDPGIADVAGIVLGGPGVSKAGSAGAVVRLRNGDWLPGDLEQLDAGQLRYKSTSEGPLRIARANLGALYFSAGNGTPVSDASTDRGFWMRSPFGGGEAGPGQSRCRYLDGSFFPFADRQNQPGGADLAALGRCFPRLPEKVEVSFDISVLQDEAGFNLQLFADPVRGGGLSIDFSGNMAGIQDMSPQPGNVQAQPVTVDLERAGVKGSPRRFRFLTDRKTGQMAMFVNGTLAGRYSPRAGRASPKRGKYVFFAPQVPGMTVFNLWVAPWAGTFPRMPAAPKPAEPGDPPRPPEPTPPPSEVISLINGDETPGAVLSATPEEIRMQYDGGDVEFPLSRALMIEFAGPPVAPVPGIRLRLTGGGVLTVQSFTLAGGMVSCRSSLLGDVKFPLSALSEIAWQRPGQKASAGIPPGDAQPGGLPPAPSIPQARLTAASLDAARARSYDVIETLGEQESVTGRFGMKTTVGDDSVTLDDDLRLTKPNVLSMTRKTVAEKNAALRVKHIAAESQRGVQRREQTLTVADGKATFHTAGAAKSPDQVFDYPPNTVTLFSLMRIVTALPRDAGGEWAVARVFNEFRMRPLSDESYRLECGGKETVERDNRTRTLTRFTLRHERNEENIVAEFFLDDSGVVQWMDFLQDTSARGTPISLRLRTGE